MRSTNELRTVVVIIFANAKQMRATDPLKPFMDIISEEAGASGCWLGCVCVGGCVGAKQGWLSVNLGQWGCARTRGAGAVQLVIGLSCTSA